MSAKPLNLCDKLKANVVSDHCSSEETFYFAEGPSGSILSWVTLQKPPQLCRILLKFH